MSHLGQTYREKKKNGFYQNSICSLFSPLSFQLLRLWRKYPNRHGAAARLDFLPVFIDSFLRFEDKFRSFRNYNTQRSLPRSDSGKRGHIGPDFGTVSNHHSGSTGFNLFLFLGNQLNNKLKAVMDSPGVQ